MFFPHITLKTDFFNLFFQHYLHTHTQAFVKGGDQFPRDVKIPSLVLRNRALEGDIVVVALDPQSEWLVLEKDAANEGAYEKKLFLCYWLKQTVFGK